MMKMNREEVLIEAIKDSGFYEYREVNLDDLPKLRKSAIILAGALVSFRPDLFSEYDPDVVFTIQRIFENGVIGNSLPTKSLSKLLETPPYDDSFICSYSLKDEKILKKIYKGTGTKWEVLK